MFANCVHAPNDFGRKCSRLGNIRFDEVGEVAETAKFADIAKITKIAKIAGRDCRE